jgi:hypothetical protein
MTPKLQEKPSALKREHLVFKHHKILDLFLFLWVIFALLDPEFECGSGNSNECGSGSETLGLTDGFKTLKLSFAPFKSAPAKRKKDFQQS